MSEPISTRNLDRYGSAALPWSRTRDVLAADTPGPAPWHVYRLTLHSAVGVATAEPHGSTRWTFAR